MPQLEDFVQLSDDDVSSGDEEDVEVIEVSDPFDQAECKEIRMSKKLRRGLQYVKSGYVGHVHDSLPDRIHAYKALVRASMNAVAYEVQVAISQVSGNIVRCKCDSVCPQNALGRCSHISALLLFILLHKNLNGPEGKCTILILFFAVPYLKIHIAESIYFVCCMYFINN